MIQIDRTKAQERFLEYTSAYDVSDPKIRLKIEHTLRVAELCETIAQSLGMSRERTDLAWLIGLLHDIGRFEQLRQFGTFLDAESIDHAKFGADLLFQEGLIPEFYTGEECYPLIEKAVRFHSAYRLPELTEEEQTYADILRDADKIDILKVNCIVPLEEIYNVTTEDLYHSQISEAVLESFRCRQATLRSLKKTPADHLAGHISLIFELVFPESCRLVVDQGYLEELLSFPSQNPTTLEQFIWMREEIGQYLETIK